MKKGPALPAFFVLLPPGEGARRADEGANFRMARMRGNDWLLHSSVAARHLLPEGEGQPNPPSPACGCHPNCGRSDCCTGQIGRVHVCTPVNNAHIIWPPVVEKKQKQQI